MSHQMIFAGRYIRTDVRAAVRICRLTGYCLRRWDMWIQCFSHLFISLSRSCKCGNRMISTGFHFRQTRAQVIAISLETAIQVDRKFMAWQSWDKLKRHLSLIQNAAIGFVVLNLTFESPYSDMGVIPVLSFLFFSTGKILYRFIIFCQLVFISSTT